jgi:copper homeostasis protein
MQLLIGSGINSQTLPPLLNLLEPVWSVKEIHLSGGRWVEGDCEPNARKEDMEMGAGGEVEWKVWRTSRDSVAATYKFFMEFRLSHC